MTTPIKRQLPNVCKEYRRLVDVRQQALISSFNPLVKPRWQDLWHPVALTITALLEAMDNVVFIPNVKEGEDGSKYDHRVDARLVNVVCKGDINLEEG